MGKAPLNIYKYVNALEKLDCEAIGRAIVLISDCLNLGGKLFTAGNGGSYSIAQHFAADLRGPIIENWTHKRDDEVRRVIHLGSNLAEYTALCNDKGYEKALLWMAKRDGIDSGDILFVFSVSGESDNIQLLADEAFYRDFRFIMATNKPFFGELRDRITIIQIKTGETDNDWYGVAESVFSCIAHEIANRVKERLNEQQSETR